VNPSAIGDAASENMSPSRIPAEKLIEELQSIADQLGRPPSLREIDELSSYSRSTYQDRFGSWNDAVEEAGLEPRHSSTANIEDRELLEELDRLAENLDRTPRQRDMEQHGKYSVTTYQNRFGSWNDALRKADHQPTKQWKVDRDDLLAELRRLGSRLGSSPTAAEMDEEGTFSSWVYLSEFGSWNEALEAAGYGPNQPDALSRSELQTELERLIDELDRTPRKRDMIEHGEYSPEPYRRRFGSWNAALQSVGASLNQPNPVTEEEACKELRTLYKRLGRPPTTTDVRKHGSCTPVPILRIFSSWEAALRATDQQVLEEYLLRKTLRPTQRFGENWHSKREEVIHRDNEQCVWCGMARERHQDEYGMDLHVHHRIPRSEFAEASDQELEDADVQQNLLTVCAGCHRQLEQLPIQPLPPPE